MKELLVRLMYCEMLGHSASFGHITALKMAQQGSLHLKRVGMLAFQPRMTTFFVNRKDVANRMFKLAFNISKTPTYILVLFMIAFRNVYFNIGWQIFGKCKPEQIDCLYQRVTKFLLYRISFII